MNPIILKQLKQLTNAMLKHNDKIVCLDEITSDMTEFDVIPLSMNLFDLKTTVDYVFNFEGYLLKDSYKFNIQWNNSKGLPLKIMQGRLIKQVNNNVYLKCKGVLTETNICAKCFKFGNWMTLCEDCKKDTSNITDISWEGWVPLNAIKEVKEV